MAHWLVTGGAGFIGSSIAETLVLKGEKVRVLDDLSAGKKENLNNVLNKIEFFIGDIRDEKMVEKAAQDMDYVLHQAAMRSVPRSVKYPEECNSVNITGTLNCLLAAKKARIKKFVLASSSSVYGDSLVFPQREKNLPQPISPYAVSKLCGEYYARVFAKTYGLSTIALRYFNVYGPKQDPKSKYAAVIPKFIISAIKGEKIEVHWDGKQSRDFSYVLDVAQANIKAALAKKISFGVYNVACGQTTSLLQIISLLEKLMNKKLSKEFFSKREGDVRKTFADIGPIQKDLDFKPQYNFKTGLEKTFEYFFKNDRWKAYK